MPSGFTKRYTIFFPDGSVAYRNSLGDAKGVGETIKADGRKWEIVRSVKLIGEEIDYELHVEAADD
jgi:hypothetical protein